MPTSAIDRRVLGALTAAVARLEALTPNDGIAAQLVEVARQLVTRSAGRLQAAMDVEDKEEIEAVRAADERRVAFDRLGDAFARLYAGLTAGVSLSALRGEDSPSLRDLRAYLDETNPSSFRAQSFQASLSIFRIARTWADDYVPAAEAPRLLSEVDAFLAAAQEANTRAEKEAGEAAVAFRALEAERLAARQDYLAARSAVLGALNLTGTSDQINRFMPAFDRVVRRVVRNAAAADEVESLFDPLEGADPEQQDGSAA